MKKVRKKSAADKLRAAFEASHKGRLVFDGSQSLEREVESFNHAETELSTALESKRNWMYIVQCKQQFYGIEAMEEVSRILTKVQQQSKWWNNARLFTAAEELHPIETFLGADGLSKGEIVDIVFSPDSSHSPGQLRSEMLKACENEVQTQLVMEGVTFSCFSKEQEEVYRDLLTSRDFDYVVKAVEDRMKHSGNSGDLLQDLYEIVLTTGAYCQFKFAQFFLEHGDEERCMALVESAARANYKPFLSDDDEPFIGGL